MMEVLKTVLLIEVSIWNWIGFVATLPLRMYAQKQIQFHMEIF